jgi:hypothetical protein
MNAFDDNNVKPQNIHTDLARPPGLLLFWGFDVQLLAQAYGGYYEGGVFKALLTGLKELSESKNKRKRERDFTMWGGHYLHDTFWIGVPSSLSAEVTDSLSRHLWQVAGFSSQEYSDYVTHPFIAIFRYDHGRIIEYSVVSDGVCSDAYGSGVDVSYQLLGEEQL